MIDNSQGKYETVLILFTGYLRALNAIDIEFDVEKNTYIEKASGKTIGEIVREFLDGEKISEG